MQRILSALGVATEWAGQVLLIRGERLELFPEDSGIRLAWVLASMAWHAALPRPGAPRAADRPFPLFRAALAGGLAGWAAQGPGVLIAAGLVTAFGSRAGQLWLGTGLWVTTALLAGGVAAGLGPRLRARGRAPAALTEHTPQHDP